MFFSQAALLRGGAKSLAKHVKIFSIEDFEITVDASQANKDFMFSRQGRFANPQNIPAPSTTGLSHNHWHINPCGRGLIGIKYGIKELLINDIHRLVLGYAPDVVLKVIEGRSIYGKFKMDEELPKIITETSEFKQEKIAAIRKLIDLHDAILALLNGYCNLANYDLAELQSCLTAEELLKLSQTLEETRLEYSKWLERLKSPALLNFATPHSIESKPSLEKAKFTAT